jgi:MarR family transcriptional regulator, lower aerobic nicotinate degradation pathway regulator
MINPLYRELIALTEEFEADHPDVQSHQVTNFSAWLQQRLQKESDFNATERPDWKGRAQGMMVDDMIVNLVSRLNRYARLYTKIALADSVISTVEEFSFAISLHFEGEKSKKQLIEENVLEKSAGMEIIKRMRNRGLIQEKANPEDGRSKLMMITDMGKGALFAAIGKVSKVSQIVGGNLTEEQKFQLVALGQQLDHFHQPVYHQKLPDTIDDLFDQLELSAKEC